MKTETIESVGKERGGYGALDRNALVWVRATGVAGFALATAAGACVAIPLPGTPVPLTLQTLFVLLAGVTLGPRLGTLSMAFYLLLGTTGHHVFAGGNWGLSTVFGATGGYLLGFTLAQPLVGWLSRKQRRPWRGVATALLAGNIVIFATGLLWLSMCLGTGPSRTLEMGLWPFVPGEVVKTAAALGAGRLLLPARRRWFEASTVLR